MWTDWIEVNVSDGVVLLDKLRVDETTPVSLLRGSFGRKNRVADLLHSLSGRRHVEDRIGDELKRFCVGAG